MDLLERFFGLAMGKYFGDAALAPYENMKAEKIIRDLERRGGLKPHRYRDPWCIARGKPDLWMNPGQPTDDTELFVIALWCAARYPEFSAEYFYNALRRFIHGRQPMLGEVAYGTGGTLEDALRPATYRLSCRAFSRGEIPLVPSNGGIMRDGWESMRYHGKTPQIVRIARWQSCVTHMHPLSQAACIAHAVFLSQVLDGLAPAVAWEVTREILTKPAYAKIPELRTMLGLPLTEPTQGEIWPQTGSVVLSLRIALWASLTATSLMDGMLKVARVGGDTDTYGSIAGGILGAHYGYEAIPEEWRNVLYGEKKIRTLVKKVYDLAHPVVNPPQ